MDLKAVILGFLTRGSLTGYELKKAMDESVGFFFGASYGSIYPALKGLEGDGSVRVERVVQSDRPNKKVYTLTPEGEARFRKSLEEPPAGDSFRSEFLMRLFFGAHGEPGRLLEQISRYRESQEEGLEKLRRVEEEVEGVATPYEMLCLRYGLESNEAKLRWLEGVEREVRALGNGGDGSRRRTEGGER